MSQSTRTLKAKYNLVGDAHRQARSRADKGRAFALLVRVHHRDVFAEPGAQKVRRARKASKASTPAAAAAEAVAAVKAEACGAAPCALPREILELIIGLLGAPSLDEVLRESQRWAFVSRVSDAQVGYQQRRIWRGFPRAGEDDNGYRWIQPCGAPAPERVLALEVVQAVMGKRVLRWKVCVDLGLVPAPEAGEVVVPAAAISIETNAQEVAGELNLSGARVEELLGFRLRGRLADRGATMRFEAEAGALGMGAGDRDRALGFDVKLAVRYVSGMHLDAHAGLRVGDRVRVVETYRAYQDFAVGLEGVVRMIRLNSFVLFFVELGEEASAVSQRVVAANLRWRGVFPGQEHWQVACQRFHLLALGT